MGINVKTHPRAIYEYRLKLFEDTFQKTRVYVPKDLQIRSNMWEGIYGVFQLKPPKPKEHLMKKLSGAFEALFFGSSTEPEDNYEIIARIQCNIDNASVELTSKNVNADEFLRKMAVEFTKDFAVTLILYSYNGENRAKGSLKCKYCGQFTKNNEKCDYCGAVPI